MLMAVSAEALDVKDRIQRSQILRRELAFSSEDQAVFILFEQNSEQKSIAAHPIPCTPPPQLSG